MVLNPRIRTSLRYLLIALLVWVLLALISYLALPSYIKTLAIEQVQTQLGRKLDIGKVDFNLFALTLYADDVVLYDPDNTTPLLSVKAVTASASIGSLLRLAPVLDEVKLVGPKAHIVRLSAQDIGVYNFSDIIDKINAKPPSETKTEFAVANIQLEQGDIQFDDKVTGKSVHVDSLNIGIPYISNFTSKINAFVQPKLSANIDGTPFALAGRSKPFSDTQETTLAIDINHLDLTEYLPFVPASLPVLLQSAKLTTALDLGFSVIDDRSRITLSGDITLDDAAIADKAKNPLFKAQRISAKLNNFDVLDANGTIEQATITSPQVWAALDKQGNVNWLSAFASSAQNKTAQPVETPAKTAQTAKNGITLTQFAVTDGVIHWSDDANAKPRQETTLAGLAINAQGISTVAGAPAATLSVAANDSNQGNISFIGTIAPDTLHVQGKAAIKTLSLAGYQNYVNPSVNGTISGKLSATTDIDYKDTQAKLDKIGIVVEELKLTPKQSGAVTIKTVTAENGTLDLATHQLHLDALRVDDLHGDVVRTKNGTLNLQTLLPASTAAAPAVQAKKSAQPAQPWKATVGSFAVINSSINYTDDAIVPKQTLKTQAINIKLDNLASDLSTATAISIAAQFDKNGQLSVKGQSAAQLKKIDLDIQAKNVPLTPWQSFFTESVNVTLTRGNVNASGKATLVPPINNIPFALTYKGTAGLNNVRVLSKASNADFLRLNKLDISGINVDIGKARPVITLGQIALSNFFAQAVLSEQGKLNLQDIMVADQASAEPSTTPSTTVAKTTTSTAPVTEEKNAATAPLIHVGKITLNGGNINFTDNFVKPNYRVNMTGLHGTIGSITSNKVDPAAVDLQGKVDNDAPLTISGSINPLFHPLYLDIKASSHGIEMTRLSPYSTKYAGYPIEKGKLSMDVSYKIEEEKLVAQNQLRIDQLTFGDHVDGPEATKLPVMLAVSLLKDRNGTINVDLPVSGSLSDPQFSIGGVIMRVFINLIVKAVTSPFALIGSMFGSSEELSNVQFAAGSTQLNPEAIKKLDMLNTAMVDRPGLALDIIGRADPKTDEAGLAEERLYRQMRAMKRQSLPKDAREDTAAITLTPHDETKYLTEVYTKAWLDKPKNAIGLSKSLPPEEMKA